MMGGKILCSHKAFWVCGALKSLYGEDKEISVKNLKKSVTESNKAEECNRVGQG